jgi:hypothetical protein
MDIMAALTLWDVLPFRPSPTDPMVLHPASQPPPPPPRRCLLLDLPHDILDLICDELLGVAEEIAFYQVQKKTRSMCRLLRTCRTMYQVVLPRLHRTVICASSATAKIYEHVDRPPGN